MIFLRVVVVMVIKNNNPLYIIIHDKQIIIKLEYRKL